MRMWPGGTSRQEAHTTPARTTPKRSGRRRRCMLEFIRPCSRRRGLPSRLWPSGRRLYPAPHRRSVPEILVTELLRHIPLLPGDHAVGHQNERGNEQAHEPGAVRPQAQAELQQRERQIDGIPREPIGSGRDHRRDRLPRANRCPRPAKLADRKREQRHREQNQPSAYRLDGGRYHSRRPDGVEPEARQDGHQVDYRWSGERDYSLVGGDCSACRHVRVPATMFCLLVHACLPPSYGLPRGLATTDEVEVRATRPSETPCPEKMQETCRM